MTFLTQIISYGVEPSAEWIRNGNILWQNQREQITARIILYAFLKYIYVRQCLKIHLCGIIYW